jgi:hypothetical protein
MSQPTERPSHLDQLQRRHTNAQRLVQVLIGSLLRVNHPDATEAEIDSALRSAYRCDVPLHPMVEQPLMQAQENALDTRPVQMQHLGAAHDFIDMVRDARDLHAELVAYQLAETGTRLPYLHDVIRVQEQRTWKETHAWYVERCEQLGLPVEHANAEQLRKAYSRWKARNSG